MVVSDAAPVAAAWRGVDPAGLFWSMRSVGDESIGLPSPDHVRVTADFDNDGVGDAEGVFALRRGIGDLEERVLGDELPGAFLLLPERPWERAVDGRLPVVVVLGGSEGGDIGARLSAPAFASRGYAAIGLSYVSVGASRNQTAEELDPSELIEGLPQDFWNIPLESVELVRDWIAEQRELDAGRIVLHGTSKGAEFVLSAASRIEGFAGVVAIVPTDAVVGGFGPGVDYTESPPSSFSWRGEPLPFMNYPEFVASPESWGALTTARFKSRDDLQAAFLAFPEMYESARIPVEEIDEPVLLVGGGQDWLWESGAMAQSIGAARDAAGLETTLVVGELAGHLLFEAPYAALDPYSARTASEGAEALWAFLEEHLGAPGE